MSYLAFTGCFGCPFYDPDFGCISVQPCPGDVLVDEEVF